MPKPRFQIGKFWLSQRSGSTNYYATHFDAGSRQTKRISLSKSNFEEAQIKLAEFVIINASFRDEKATDMLLAIILTRYWLGHAQNIVSSVQAENSLVLWNDFWKDATLAELTPKRQEEFIEWLRLKGFKNSYVSRVLGVGRAAIKRAWRRQEIASPPFIMDVRGRSDSNEPYVLDSNEVQRLLIAAKRWPHLFSFIMIMMNTLSRPAAVLDLSPVQVDLKDRRIDLNPKGRPQTKKFRPVIPISDTLLPFVRDRECKRFVLWRNKPVASIKKTFRLAVSAAGLPAEITPYSLRHTMAIELRRRGVPAWEVEGLLGHRRPGVTEIYAKYDPAYLSLGRKAIDAFFAELDIPLSVLADPSVSIACHTPDLGASHVV